MADVLDRCRFVAGSSGTADFADGTAQTGFRNLEDAGAIDGRRYAYAAQSADGTQWELGDGVYSASGDTLGRDFRSSSTGSLIDFSSAPTVIVTPLSEEISGRPFAMALLFGG